DQALPDLRHLDLEQLDEELRRGAGHEKLRAARLRAHLDEQRLHAVLRPHGLARHHLVTRHEPLRVPAEIDDHAVAVDPLHQAGEQLAHAILVFLDDLLPLGLAHLLHDDLLRGLRGDAAELDRLHRHFHVAAGLGVGIDLECVLQAQLPVRELELGGIVREHLPAAERLVVAGGPVDLHADVDVLAVAPAGRGRERGFDCLEYDFLVDALLVRDGIDDHQYFLAHASFTPRCRYSDGTSRADSIAASARRCTWPSTSTAMSSSSAAVSLPRKLRRPSTGARSFTRTSSPTKRRKCAGFVSFRSRPGDETSST